MPPADCAQRPTRTHIRSITPISFLVLLARSEWSLARPGPQSSHRWIRNIRAVGPVGPVLSADNSSFRAGVACFRTDLFRRAAPPNYRSGRRDQHERGEPCTCTVLARMWGAPEIFRSFGADGMMMLSSHRPIHQRPHPFSFFVFCGHSCNSHSVLGTVSVDTLLIRIDVVCRVNRHCCMIGIGLFNRNDYLTLGG